MMISKRDIEMMENDVRDIDVSWGNTVRIFTPLPSEQQPNWNPILHEYTGEIAYTDTVVPAERKDMQNAIHDDVGSDISGDKISGTMIYAIPDLIDGSKYEINTDMIFAIDDTKDRYYVKSVKHRIGESIVIIQRYDGGTPSGAGDTIGQS